MSYRDSIQQASFRGVPFEVNTVQGTHGRRTVSHKYPQRNKGFVEDLGRETPTFSFDGFVLEPDYLIKKANLINAIEAFSGPGELIHPFLGRMLIVVKSFNVHESKEDGGVAFFTFVCEESGEVVYPSPQEDTIEVVNTKASEAISASRESFITNFSTVGQPDFINTEAQNVVNEGLLAIDEARGS